MAYSEERVCIRCFKGFSVCIPSEVDALYSSQKMKDIKLCPVCSEKIERERFREKENKRDKWLFKRGELTIEQRIKDIEEWMYDHDR